MKVAELIYIAILGLYLLLFLFSLRERAERSETKLPKVFLRMAALLEKKAQDCRGPARRRKAMRIEEELNILYPKSAQNQGFLYRRDKLAYALMILLVGTILSFAMYVSSRQKERELRVIERGGSERTVSLTAQLGEEGNQREETVTLQVEGKEYAKEEIEAYMEQIQEELPTLILGENEDIDHVTKPLNLFGSMDQNPVRVTWISGDYGLMDGKGKIRALEIAEEGELCMLTARLSCQGYEEEVRFYVRICPGEKTEHELLREELEQAIRRQEEADRTSWEITLPEEVAGNRVVWVRRTNDNSVVIMALAAALAAGVYFAKDGDLHKKIQQRKGKLLLEYPEFVSRLVLLVGAGMTVRGAMYKMAETRQGRRTETAQGKEAHGKEAHGKEVHGKEVHGKEAQEKAALIYEEVAYLCNELDSGISEAKAYYNLGRRCGEQRYIRLCMLLSQNLRKGTAELTALLRSESAEAFEERKRNARRVGEEAGTKLLLPMSMMLVIVMMIIMVPAFLSFSV